MTFRGVIRLQRCRIDNRKNTVPSANGSGAHDSGQNPGERQRSVSWLSRQGTDCFVTSAPSRYARLMALAVLCPPENIDHFHSAVRSTTYVWPEVPGIHAARIHTCPCVLLYELSIYHFACINQHHAPVSLHCVQAAADDQDAIQ